MLLSKITPETLKQLMRERVTDTENFTKKLQPRICNENPYYTKMVSSLINMLEKESRSQNVTFTQFHRDIILYVSMACFRALELAHLKESSKDSVQAEAMIFLSDPNLMATTPDVLESFTEMYILMLQIGPREVQRKI